MFQPTKEEVRRFFIEAWRKRQARDILTPLETIAADWIAEHPEYHLVFAHPHATQADFSADQDGSNPFLHLSMHLSITEQVSIDQPPGIRAAFDALTAREGSVHQAAHQVMECLGQVLWEAQRSQSPPDTEAYMECIQRRIRTAN